MRIWFPKPLGDEVIAELQSLAPGHLISKDPSPDAEMLIEGRVEREQIESNPSIKWVVVPFAGVPAATVRLAREFPRISLHNLHHNAGATAETALALLLAAAKRLVPMDQAMRRNDWTPRYEPGLTRPLDGGRALILGYGTVGRRVGAALEAMGMQVTGVRRSPGPGEFGPDRLPELLPKADVLMITAPHTSETEGLIGEREISILPPGAILINVARAQIVDERALYEALASGKLHSAGMDVWYRYPQEEGTAVPTYFVAPPSAANTPPANFPFGQLPNVVMSPHRGGATAATERERVQHLAPMVRAAAEGRPVPNKVDLELGY